MKGQKNSEISWVFQALKPTVGGINISQVCSCQRYLTIPFQGPAIDVGAQDAVS